MKWKAQGKKLVTDWKVEGRSDDEIFECEVVDEDTVDIVHALNDFMVYLEDVKDWKWKVIDGDGERWFTVIWNGDDCEYSINRHISGRGLGTQQLLDEYDAMVEELERFCAEWSYEAREGFPYAAWKED